METFAASVIASLGRSGAFERLNAYVSQHCGPLPTPITEARGASPPTVGEVLWTLPLRSDAYEAAGWDDLIVVAENVTGAVSKHTYHSFDSESGEELTSKDLPSPGGAELMFTAAEPKGKQVLIDAGVAYTAAQGLTTEQSVYSLRGIDPRTLSVLWTLELGSCAGDNCGLPVAFAATPGASIGVVSLESTDQAWGVDLTTGDIVWTLSDGYRVQPRRSDLVELLSVLC